MYAVREIHQVHDRTVVVHLPQDFMADSVEVIILPAQPSTGQTPSDLRHFLTMDVSHLTDAQRERYHRACAIIRQGRRPNEPRILGLLDGLIQVAEDFDAPLPDEAKFWGQGTDEYGKSVER